MGAGQRSLMPVPLQATRIGIGQIALHRRQARRLQGRPLVADRSARTATAGVVGRRRRHRTGRGHEVRQGTARLVQTGHRASRGHGDGRPRLRRRAGPAPLARPLSVRLYRTDDQPRLPARLLQRHGAAWRRSSRTRTSRTACRMPPTASSTCRPMKARSACGARSRVKPTTYIGMFATDFLMQAKDHKYVIPEEGIERALKWARKASGTESNTDLARAYGFYLLARAGKLNPSELRYFADTRVEGMTNPFALGLMGAALGRYRRPRTCRSGLHESTRSRGRRRSGEVRLRHDVLRLAPARRRGLDRNVGQGRAGRSDPGARLARPRLRPASQLHDDAGKSLDAAGSARDRRNNAARERHGLGRARDAQAARCCASARPWPRWINAISLKNNGQKDVWRIVSAEGIPATPLPATQNGVTISKAILTMTGAPANLADCEAERPLHRASVG